MNYEEHYGEWALVVGASVTVGEQFVRQLADRGLNVAMVARNEAKLRAIAEDIESRVGVETRVIALDLSEDRAVEALLEETNGLEIGYLVLNANLHKVNFFRQMPAEHKRLMLRMNLELPVMLAHHYGPHMVARRRGAIVFINALNSLSPIEIDAIFQGTKSGLRVFAESLWLEYRRFGVRVASAMVNGIEGSESYEAKLSPARRRLAKLVGVSMAPEKIVAKVMRQLDRGGVTLVPDTPVFINRIALKFLDLMRFFGGKWSLRVTSWVFGAILDGEEVTRELGKGS